MIAPYLERHLVDIGMWDADGVSRKARVRRHSCGALIVVGLDGDLAALPAVVDLVALTPLGEAMAQLDGRRTYALRGRDRLTLDRRDDFAIAGSPAGTRDYYVCPEHRCGSPLAGDGVTAPMSTTRAAVPDPTTAPF